MWAFAAFGVVSYGLLFQSVSSQATISYTTQYNAPCDERLTGDNGTFTSPNYPNNYPNGKDCRYGISVTPPKVARLTFTDFSLEPGYDFLWVYDGNTTDEAYEIGKFDGPNTPGPVTSASSSMTVRFKSDESVTRKGFQANYAAVDKVFSTCDIGEYLCADGVTCIKAWKRCDGNRDCRGGDDEDANKCAKIFP
ncbi:PREDICTED: bone morphogenetic protein 1-like [Branchiostoma belcheri]|uniref:Bone morphogenetic protein 1-like n=1 Tax=Branchiostoma belcheri TaxID=7741 RepID=A0A6P4YCJ2_BRABE|nr:PREDICTED: bone morphogenetic protein 1-like [Branchiostoma belcheri]